ncbi:hypothetical protein [Alkalimarinus sediminis]|uniref:Uncharacterized protein n=1 Tax=Alkalimarinus sediminis TaxID=1632866 RepID=A0A9E8HH69_9ALTE|nr:hypothetical protein [Alkalimarinus sediminis]UZW73302.1 hypothetical protein NNL22_09570 [Alkalimarinus sediminis]
MRAKFEARELNYNGIERRTTHRRTQLERRSSVRFEPHKQDRRQIQGRREHDGDSWLLHDL